MISVARISLLLAALLTGSAWCSLALADEFAVKGNFDFKKKKGPNLSGLECLDPRPDSTEICLAVDDEMNSVQFAELQGLTLIPGAKEKVFEDNRPVVGQPPHLLLNLPGLNCSVGADGDELDGEAIAHLDNVFYVVGSQGCSKTGKYRPETFFLAKFTVDADGEITDSAVSYRLSEAIMTDAALAKAFGTDLPGGSSVEGLAAANGKLFVGFRSPADPGAVILEVPADALFSKDGSIVAKDIKRHDVPLGKHIGFRDLEALDDGNFLALTGPDGEPTSDGPYALQLLSSTFETKGDAVPVPVTDDGSPEAVEALGTITDGRMRVVVLFDGGPNGGPELFDIAQ